MDENIFDLYVYIFFKKCLSDLHSIPGSKTLEKKGIFSSMNELMPLFSVNRNLRENRSDPVHWVMDQEAAKHVAVASALLSSACDSQLQR